MERPSRNAISGAAPGILLSIDPAQVMRLPTPVGTDAVGTFQGGQERVGYERVRIVAQGIPRRGGQLGDRVVEACGKHEESVGAHPVRDAFRYVTKSYRAQGALLHQAAGVC